jgi:hypothetical protein
MRKALRPVGVGLALAFTGGAGHVAAAEPEEHVAYVLEPIASFDNQAKAQVIGSLLRLRVSDGGEFALASGNPSLLALGRAVKCDLRGFDPAALAATADRNLDEGCQRSMAARLGAGGLFWGHLYDGPGGRLWVKLHLWRKGKAGQSKALPYDEALRERLVGRLYEHLTHPERAADVRVGGPAGLAGELWVDEKGQGVFSEGTELTVSAGKHTFELRQAGRVLARASAVVTAGEANSVRLTFVPRTDLDPTEGLRDPPPVVTKSEDDWKRTAGFGGLGLGAVALGAGIFSSFRVARLDDRLASGPYELYRASAPGQRACAAAAQGFVASTAGAASSSQVDNVCSQGSTFRTAQFVAYPLAAVFVGVGSYFLLTSPKAPASKAALQRRLDWTIVPGWGASGAGAWLHGQFLDPRPREAAGMRRAYATFLSVFASGVLASLLAASCGLDDSPFDCADSRRLLGDQAPSECLGGGGTAGVSGVGGTAGVSGAGGVGGAGTAGIGGRGGSSGSASCAQDGDCTAAGSLCVTQACTTPSTTCSKGTLVVVPDAAFAGTLAAELDGACFYRALAPALTAAATNGSSTTRVVVYATAVTGPALVPAGVRLEGRPTAPAAHVAWTASGGAGAAGAGGAALVTLSDGAALAGFALDAAGTVGVRIDTGKASLHGPLEVRGGAPAVSVEGTASATVTGTAEAKVLFTANERGLYAAGTAGLEVSGVGGESVVIEKTSKGAGVLFDKGQIDKGELKVTGALVRDNTGSNGFNGSGGIEVRESRKATVSGGTFSGNNTAVGFQGAGISATVSGGTFSGNNTAVGFQGSPGDMANAFQGITLTDNAFSAPALPGVVICGTGLGADGTTLRLGPDNDFPTGGEASPATCQAFEDVQVGNCTGGFDIGFTGSANKFDVVCQ